MLTLLYIYNKVLCYITYNFSLNTATNKKFVIWFKPQSEQHVRFSLCKNLCKFVLLTFYLNLSF